MREMRRSRQLLSTEETEALLDRNTSGVVAVMGDEGFPYGVPVSYVYLDGRIYFHSGKKGYKTECFAERPKVCFTVIDTDDIVEEEYTSYFRSAIATGTIRIADGDERRTAFLAMCRKYSGSMPEDEHVRQVDGCSASYIYAIDIVSLTGKQAIELVPKMV